MPPSPQKSLANLVAVATVAGVILWRENYWQTRLHDPESAAVAAAGSPPPTQGPGGAASPAAPGGTAGRAVTPGAVTDDSLLEQNAGLQQMVVAQTDELRSLKLKISELQTALEAAKPPPTPEELAGKYTAQRGLRLDPAFKFQAAPVERILGKIQESVETALPEAVADTRARAALAMGFTSDPFDYRSAMVSLAQMTSGGFFQQEDQTLLYREEASLRRADGRELLISALAPALLKQFPLTRENFYDTPNDDAAIAALSLINGDANSARVRFSITDQMAQNLDRAGTPAPSPSASSAPNYLTEIWKFTQDKGSLFAEALIGKGGLPALNNAYKDPPRTSSEILHPETLYLGGPPFEPVKMDFPEPVLAGSAPYFTNVAGEFGTYIILRSWFDVDTATVAAEGWMGDRYLVWKGPEPHGDHVFWKSAWRTEQDAREFFDTLRRSLMQRFSIPWRAEYDAVADQFIVQDPRRIIRLSLNPAGKTVSLQNSTDPAFAAELEKAASRW